MNVLNQQSHEIAVYSNRLRLIGVTSIIELVSLLIVGMDIFAIWAFFR